MKRIQINLDKELKNALTAESKLLKKNISQVIRDILWEKLLGKKTSNFSLTDIAGLWKDRDFNVNEYIREKRGGVR